MAIPKEATVIDVEPIGDSGRRLRLKVEHRPFDPRAGQFLIVDTGLTDPSDEKPIKRAYSIVSFTDDGTVELWIDRVGDGSVALQSLSPGDGLRFSGPWGKFGEGVEGDEGDVGGEGRPERSGLTDGATLIVTDTAITAALGLLGPAGPADTADSDDRWRSTSVIWFHAADDAFVSIDEVERRARSRGVTLHRFEGPPVGDPSRLSAFREAIDSLVQARSGHIWLAGDGELIGPYADVLSQRVGDGDGIRTEYFFNRPVRSR